MAASLQKRVRHGGRGAVAFLLAVALVAASLAPSARVKKRRPAVKPVAAAGGGAKYDAALYAKASGELKAGKLDEAVGFYCSMLPKAKNGSAYWSVSISLICDKDAVEPLVSRLEKSQGAPVFVLKKEYKGTQCYRVCFSLAPSRRAATLKLRTIQKQFLKYKPFPFELDGLCVAAEPQAATAESEPLAAKQPAEGGTGESVKPPEAKPAEEKPRQQASGPVRYLGPPVSQNAPPAIGSASPAAAGSSGPLLSSLKAGAAKDAAKIPEPSKEAESLFQKGVEAYGKGDRGGAQRYYQQSLELSPNKPETLNNLAILYLEQNRFAEAKSLLERAIDISPSYSRAHLNLAGALWGLGERDKAIEQARLAKDLEASSVQAHLTLASFLIATGKKEEGGLEARLALALEPGNAQAQALAREAEKGSGK